MKKLLLLSLVSFVFSMEAMEQDNKGNKRKRDTSTVTRLFDEEQEVAPLTPKALFVQKMVDELGTVKKQEKKFKKVLKSGDTIEKNILLFDGNERSLFIELLAKHLRYKSMHMFTEKKDMAKSFSQDFLEELRKQDENQLPKHSQETTASQNVYQSITSEQELYGLVMGNQGEQ